MLILVNRRYVAIDGTVTYGTERFDFDDYNSETEVLRLVVSIVGIANIVNLHYEIGQYENKRIERYYRQGLVDLLDLHLPLEVLR